MSAWWQVHVLPKSDVERFLGDEDQLLSTPSPQFAGGWAPMSTRFGRELVRTVESDRGPCTRHRKCFLTTHGVRFVNSGYEAAEGADALLVLTEWDEFKQMDYARVHQSLRYPIIVDGRNLLSPEEMRRLDFTYLSIGRPDVIPSEANLYASAAAAD